MKQIYNITGVHKIPHLQLYYAGALLGESDPPAISAGAELKGVVSHERPTRMGGQIFVKTLTVRKTRVGPC
jgi:hypothetical protein